MGNWHFDVYNKFSFIALLGDRLQQITETQSLRVLFVLIVMEMVSLFADFFLKMNGIKNMQLICRFALIPGAVLCSQCKGCGVNSVDFFGGQFKAGDSCWLCG